MRYVSEEPIRIIGKPEAASQVCRFVVNRTLFPGRSFDCSSREQAKGSKLLECLFEVDGVEEVLVSGSSVTIYKETEEEWKTFGKKIGTAIREAIHSGEDLISADLDLREVVNGEGNLGSSEALAVQKVLDEEVNPSVAMHGGFVTLIDVRDSRAYLQLSGGCQGCGMADATLKQGIEVAIKGAVPAIKEVIDVTEHAMGENPYYK